MAAILGQKQVVDKKWLRIIASYKNAYKKAENNTEKKEGESCFEMLFTQTSSVLRSSCFREQRKKYINKIKDLLHYLVLQVKYFQATGYTGDCYIWRSFEGGGYGRHAFLL